MIASALVVGLATLLVGAVAAVVMRRLPSLRLQLAALAVVAVALPLGAVVLSGSVMLDVGSTGEFVAVAMAAGVASLVGATVVARDVARRIEKVRTASVRLADGDLSQRAPVGGPVEVAELASAFNTMADHLQEVDGARRQLVAWASHDLRAPVASLQAVIEAIEDGVVEPGEYMAVLGRQVRLLGGLVDDLFQLACLDAGAMSIELVTVDLVAVVAECVARFAVDARSAGCSLETLAPQSPLYARCSPEHVERVLSNLVDNALRHTPKGGWVTVGVERAEEGIAVSVTDSGPGIPAELSSRVFEPFFRAEVARTPSAGNAGLGLAIARGLVEAQGGRIWAESPPGEGACLRVLLTPASPVLPLLHTDPAQPAAPLEIRDS